MGLEYFANDKYRVLECMAERQISVKGSKVNGIIAELKSDGYITQQSPRGKYSLTDKARAALVNMQNGGIGQ